MQFKSILYEKNQKVAKIILNTPQNINALTISMVKELMMAIEDVSKDSSLRAVVLKGNSRGFCAGGDVKLMKEGLSINKGREWLGDINNFILKIMTLDKPVIASVNGAAYGAGCNLALACDIIIASEDARFCEVFSRIGLVPDAGGTFLLPKLIGLARAKDLILTGREITAGEAKEMGIIQYVVPNEQIEEKTDEIVAQLSNGPTKAFGMAKKLLIQGLALDITTALENEANVQTLCMNTEDHKEGVRAFFEKRKPDFLGN